MSLTSLTRPCSRLISTRSISRTSTSIRCSSSQSPQSDIAEQLRQVMRQVPQPVAIAITHSRDASSSPTYHGATLSSFTSLTLHPHPLVAFSLRLPSRLADSLRPTPPLSALSENIGQSEVESGLPPDPLADHTPTKGKSVGISLLTRSHESIAKQLSQPGQDHSSLFSSHPFSTIPSTPGSAPHHPELESIPILHDAIGNLRCEVVSSLALKDVYGDVKSEEDIEFDDEVEGAGLYKPPPQAQAENSEGQKGLIRGDKDAEVHGSELFICRVLDVQSGKGGEDPMLYWKHEYTTMNGP